MALIKCKECGHEVSDRSSECPNCGCPIQREDNPSIKETNVEPQAEKKGNSKKWALLAVSLCLVLGGGYYAYTKFFKSVSEKDAIVELTPEFIAAIEKYDQLGIFSEGYAAVQKGNKWGYINTKGEEVIPTNIEAYCVGRFSEGLAFVAYGTNNANFSIIDTEGKQIFQGQGYTNDNYDSPESHDLPYFLNGKIYVPVLQSKRDVYDKQGNKLETITREAADSICSNSIGCPQEVFFEETNCVGEVEERVCRNKYGVKDSVGNLIVAAKYDYIVYDCIKDGKWMPCLSNGVMLVVLEELDENQYVGGNDTKPIKKHYGYANLRGNDTFSESIKQKCQSSEQKAMDNYKSYLESFEQQQWNDSEDYDGDNDQPSYSSERIVTISFRKEAGGNITGSHGVDVYKGRCARLISKCITVPNGKVWIFKDYKYSDIQNRYDGCYAGICDNEGWQTIYYQWEYDHNAKGWWKMINNLSGERLYGGKKIYLFWNYPNDKDEFYFEANFIERDE